MELRQLGVDPGAAPGALTDGQMHVKQMLEELELKERRLIQQIAEGEDTSTLTEPPTVPMNGAANIPSLNVHQEGAPASLRAPGSQSQQLPPARASKAKTVASHDDEDEDESDHNAEKQKHNEDRARRALDDPYASPVHVAEHLSNLDGIDTQQSQELIKQAYNEYHNRIADERFALPAKSTQRGKFRASGHDDDAHAVGEYNADGHGEGADNYYGEQDELDFLVNGGARTGDALEDEERINSRKVALADVDPLAYDKLEKSVKRKERMDRLFSRVYSPLR